MIEDSNLTVLTFNVWGLKIGPWSIARNVDARMQKIARQLLDLSPDTVVLQEVWSDEIARFFVHRLPYRYHSYFPDRGRLKGRMGNGLLILSRLVITEDGVLPYSCHTRTDEFLANKGFQWVQMQTACGLVYLLNTHLGAGKKPHHVMRRMKQLEELLSFIGTLPAASPVVLAGDFNFNDHSPEYRYLDAWMKSRFDEEAADTYARMHPLKPDPTFFLDRSYKARPSVHDRNERIDFVFLLCGKRSRTTVGVLDSHLTLHDPQHHLSDHAGVLTVLSLKKKATIEELFPSSTATGEAVFV